MKSFRDNSKPVRDYLGRLNSETKGVDETKLVTFKKLVIPTNKIFDEDFDTFRS